MASGVMWALLSAEFWSRWLFGMRCVSNSVGRNFTQMRRRTGSKCGRPSDNGLTDGTLAAYDDASLEQRWHINVGSSINPPMTFEVGGRQYIVIRSGLNRNALSINSMTPMLRHAQSDDAVCLWTLTLDEYQKLAAECQRLAEVVSDAAAKSFWLRAAND